MTLKGKRLLVLVVAAAVLFAVILAAVLLHLGRVWKFYGTYYKKDGAYEYTLGVYKDNTYELVVTRDGEPYVTREGKWKSKTTNGDCELLCYGNGDYFVVSFLDDGSLMALASSPYCFSTNAYGTMLLVFED